MSTQGRTQIATKQITGAIQILARHNVMKASVICSSGTCDILGALPFLEDGDSTAITLEEGQSINIDAANPGAPLDDITITPNGGSSQVMLSQ